MRLAYWGGSRPPGSPGAGGPAAAPPLPAERSGPCACGQVVRRPVGAGRDGPGCRRDRAATEAGGHVNRTKRIGRLGGLIAVGVWSSSRRSSGSGRWRPGCCGGPGGDRPASGSRHRTARGGCCRPRRRRCPPAGATGARPSKELAQGREEGGVGSGGSGGLPEGGMGGAPGSWRGGGGGGGFSGGGVGIVGGGGGGGVRGGGGGKGGGVGGGGGGGGGVRVGWRGDAVV